MKKIIQFLALSLLMSACVVAFFAFISWGESPATWKPESRFIAALIFMFVGVTIHAAIARSLK